jgi:methylenetetrahydrofolate dehydrogenase (NADP+) / methenyltetrahydrofolate cyclohydrolase
MRIDGKALATDKLKELTLTVKEFKREGIMPTIGVILVGDNAASLSYIKQKRLAAEAIGAKLVFTQLPATSTPRELAIAIKTFNTDPDVHSLIVQRPVPKEVGDVEGILNTITPIKDVDGFVPHSPHEVPVACAVIAFLTHIHSHLTQAHLVHDEVKPWLNTQTIVVIGRGETAGRPIAAMLEKYGCSVSVIHSETPNPIRILKKSTVIISCVGKKTVVKKNSIDRGVILISVGVWRDGQGKLHGDYEEDAIQDIASFYTPTPGGVGPMNVACLMENVLTAVKLSYRGATSLPCPNCSEAR